MPATTQDKRMKVLVTGALGQLGREVVRELTARGHTCIATGAREDAQTQDTEPAGSTYHMLDIGDAAHVQALMQSESPDAVIHCAAWTQVDAAEDPHNHDVVQHTNVEGTRNLAQAAQALGAKMLYVSTDYVFNGQGICPWKPEDPCAPLNRYGQTKLEGEQAAAQCMDKLFIVRTSWLFGPHGKNFVETILEAGRTRDELRVVNDQVGTPTYAPDLARLLVDMVETEAYGIYHASSSEQHPDGYISWYEFAQEALWQSGTSMRLVPVTTAQYGFSKAARPLNSRLDKNKLAQAGFASLPDWRDALRRYLDAVTDADECMPMKTKGKLRVLWITYGCSLQDGADNPCLCARHETIMARYGNAYVQLAIAYMADGVHDSKLVKDDTVYYAIDANLGLEATPDEWDKAREQIARTVEDFKPNVIQCFGAELPYGAIANDVDVPVVVHMMGFLNSYLPAIDGLRTDASPPPDHAEEPEGLMRKLAKCIRRQLPRHEATAIRPEDALCARERQIMAANRFFLGRTAWDREIVERYAPEARYYHVPEAVKQAIYNSAGKWRYHHSGRLRLFSLACADERKGIDTILHTAQILKESMHFDFEWVLAGNDEALPELERRYGIDHTCVNIQPIGFIGCSRIAEELEKADFFVHPSIIDNSPHAICEAQLVGCPVLASDVGGVPSLVEDGSTGLLFSCNEPHALASLIASTRNDEDLLTEVSQRAVQTALRRHDPEMIAHTLVRTYRDIVSESGA